MGKKGQLDTVAVDTVVKISNVTKEFKQWQRGSKLKDILSNVMKPQTKIIKALNDISLEINKGEFVAYAGANGAGKSTTIKILSGIMQPTRGCVKVLGMDPKFDRVELMKRIGIIFGQRTELWWDHPVIASFEWKQVVWDIDKEKFKKRLSKLTDLLSLKPLLNTFARELSLGQRMRADLALMLLHQPEVIFLDEPTLGLDVLAKRQIIEYLKYLNQEFNTTIVVTSHDMDDLEEMANRIILLSKGNIEFDGSFEYLREYSGSLCRIKVFTKTDNSPKINQMSLINKQKEFVEYEFDSNKISISSVLNELSKISGIVDIEINKAPIEKIITKLYTDWE